MVHSPFRNVALTGVPSLVAMSRAHAEHRCEVQLHLRSFYDLKTDAGHESYKKKRNLAFE